MGENKKIKAINGEIPLPEPVIQHIQSLLDGKHAAQTSVLSKSWYNAWLTRPNLDFDEENFQKRGRARRKRRIAGGFEFFTKKTMRRYEELNLKVESFKLGMQNTGSDSVSLAKELIMEVLKMGVNVMDLSCSSDSNLVLPYQVFETDTLVRLSVLGWKIDLPRGRKVNCWSLKSLSLWCMNIDELSWDMFPFLEDLTLYACFSYKAKVNCPRLKSLNLQSFRIDDDCFMDVFPRLEDLTLMGGCGFKGIIYCSSLKSLTLQFTSIKDDFVWDIFPCLEYLALWLCHGYKAIQISSRSLKYINIIQERKLRAKFDVPSIKKFKFSGQKIPSLSLTTVSREWESYISVRYTRNHLKASWFHELRRFLGKLSPSRVSLSMTLYVSRCSYNVEELQGNPVSDLENMTVSLPSALSGCSALLDGLFWSCRPKLITQYWFPESCKRAQAKNEFIKVLCRRLMEVSENCCTSNQSMYHDLVDMNVESFEETLGEWQPLHWKTLLDDSESPKNKQKIRFQLKWAA